MEIPSGLTAMAHEVLLLERDAARLQAEFWRSVLRLLGSLDPEETMFKLYVAAALAGTAADSTSNHMTKPEVADYCIGMATTLKLAVRDRETDM